MGGPDMATLRGWLALGGPDRAEAVGVSVLLSMLTETKRALAMGLAKQIFWQLGLSLDRALESESMSSTGGADRVRRVAIGITAIERAHYCARMLESARDAFRDQKIYSWAVDCSRIGNVNRANFPVFRCESRDASR